MTRTRQAKMVTFTHTDEVQRVREKIILGERVGYFAEVTAGGGQLRVVGYRSGSRGHETDVESREDLLLGTPEGNAWCFDAFKRLGVTDALVSSQAIRGCLQASSGDPAAETAIRESLEPGVIGCPGLRLYVPALEQSEPDAPLPKPERTSDVANGINRGEVVRITLTPGEASTLVTAVTSPGVGVWRGLPTASGSVVHLGSPGRYSNRIAATLTESSSQTTRERHWTPADILTAQEWVVDLLTAQSGTAALVIVDADLVAAGDHAPNVRMDLEVVAQAGDVAAVIVDG